MEPKLPEVYEPWWDVWDKDDYTDELEWTPVRPDITLKED